VAAKQRRPYLFLQAKSFFNAMSSRIDPGDAAEAEMEAELNEAPTTHTKHVL
jgi:hypothetical protein